MPLTILAHIHAKPGQEERLRAELLKLVEPTRKEEGCIRYDLHSDNEVSGHFVFFEAWESRELWQAHMQAPHLAAYLAAAEGLVDAFILHEMQPIA